MTAGHLRSSGCKSRPPRLSHPDHVPDRARMDRSSDTAHCALWQTALRPDTSLAAVHGRHSQAEILLAHKSNDSCRAASRTLAAWPPPFLHRGRCRHNGHPSRAGQTSFQNRSNSENSRMGVRTQRRHILSHLVPAMRKEPCISPSLSALSHSPTSL